MAAIPLLALALILLGAGTSTAQELRSADFAIVSVTPSSKHILAGQTVSFTIVAQNNGPDAADFDVDAIYSFGADNGCNIDGVTTLPPPGPNRFDGDGFFNGDGPFCEYGVVQPGHAVSMFVVSDALPDPWTTDKRVTVTARVHSYDVPFTDPTPENNSAAATVKIVGKRK